MRFLQQLVVQQTGPSCTKPCTGLRRQTVGAQLRRATVNLQPDHFCCPAKRCAPPPLQARAKSLSMSKSAVTELEASKELLDAERKEIGRARRPVWVIVAVVVTAIMFVWPLLTLPASEALCAITPVLHLPSHCGHVSCFAPVG